MFNHTIARFIVFTLMIYTPIAIMSRNLATIRTQKLINKKKLLGIILIILKDRIIVGKKGKRLIKENKLSR